MRIPSQQLFEKGQFSMINEMSRESSLRTIWTTEIQSTVSCSPHRPNLFLSENSERRPSIVPDTIHKHIKKFTPPMPKGETSVRYYANSIEQNILIAGLHRYFSLPERSQNRNRIAKDVSQYLRFFSPHWSHRAVRLWFNNNKHTYFESELETRSMAAPSPAQTSQAPVQDPAPEAGSPPAGIPAPEVVSPPAPKVQECPPFPRLATSPPQAEFQSLSPISFWNRPVGSEQSIDQAYARAAALLAEVRRTKEDDDGYPKLIEDFDIECGELFGRFGSIQADRVDPTERFCRGPTRREASQFDFPLLDSLPESGSNGDILDFSIRSSSFGQHLYAGDSGKWYGETKSIWQTRTYTDTNLAYFEGTALTGSLAAVTYVPFGGTQRTLSVVQYNEEDATWMTQALPVRTPVESMAIDSQFAYMLTGDRLYRAPIARDGACESAQIPPSASGKMTVAFADGAVAGFRSSSQLLYLTPSLEVRPISTTYRGVMCLAPIEDHLLCGVLASGVVRLITTDGCEIRGFVGHAAPVLQVAKLSEQTFASSADDATVRVWDVRDRSPIVSVATGGTTAVNVTGSTDYLISALRNRAVHVFDLRNAGGKPVLAITTQDYEATNLQYNEHNDTMALFGVFEKEAARDSMLFIDNEGQNRQRIFRIYRGFVGTER
jgi:hypothetical protein